MPLLHWSMQHCLHETQEALLELYRNLPVKPVGLMLRLISFPLGRRYAKPGDKLTHQVARLLLQPSDVRERLVNGIYRSKDTSEATGRLEDALRKVVNAEALDKRLQKALRGKLPEGVLYEDILATGIADEIISAEESDVLRSAWAARTDAIQVDDFEPQEGAVRKAQGAVLRSVK
jgi:acyl-CoA dehydrogenase